MPAMEYDPETGNYVKRFRGKLDAAACQDLAREVEADIRSITADNPDARLEFDLAEVDFIASAFLRICISAAKHRPQGKFAIINSSPEVKKIFAIAGFDRIIEVS